MLRWVSVVLPMTYAVEAMQQVLHSVTTTSAFRQDVAILTSIAVGLLGLGAATLRRRTA